MLGNKQGDEVPISRELFKIANDLDPYAEYESDEVDALIKSANEVGKSWSGSWLGYHSRIYYKDFVSPPPGSRFSQEWGFKDSFSIETKGDWAEYDFDNVVSIINKKAGNPDISKIVAQGKEAEAAFEQVKSSALSLVYSNLTAERNKFLQGIINKIESSKIFDKSDFIKYSRPSGKIMSRDIVALEKGLHTPPHIAVLSNALARKSPFQSCKELQRQLVKLASHIRDLEKRLIIKERIGPNIFIGHGCSPSWRELKDFVNDRLGLPWDEFNRVPVAGVTNITRLAQMLDQACFAFLVMTAEDEQADGYLHARMNVIHEVGLFQGRLGFERAIVLLEDGCEEFSNIQGLG